MDKKITESNKIGSPCVILGIVPEQEHLAHNAFSYFLRIHILINREKDTHLTIDVSNKHQLTLALIILTNSQYIITNADDSVRERKMLLQHFLNIDGCIEGENIMKSLGKFIELSVIIRNSLEHHRVSLWDEIRSTGYHELLPDQ